MKHLTCKAGLVLTALALLGLALPAVAQQPPQDQVPLKITMAGPLDLSGMTLPLSPPVIVSLHHAAGETADLGKFTYVDAVNVHVGVDGKPLSMNDGIGVITGEKGDAIFLSFSGPVRLTADPMLFNPETTFTITGGKGRYLGATGSGAMSIMFDHNPGKDMGTWTIVGTISRPR